MRILIRLLSCLKSVGAQAIGSDAIIMLAIMMDIIQPTILMSTSGANGSIGISALISTFGSPGHAAVAMYLFAALAAIGLWTPHLSFDARLTLMMGQFSLLVITALAAIHAIVFGAYADGIVRPWQFIFCDQYPRLGAAPVYLLAVYARAKRAI